MTPACLMHGSCLRTFLAKQDGVQQLWPLKLSPTRPYDYFNFEELLSDLITIAPVIRLHLGSRLVSARQTFGVHNCTMSREERCGCRTNPVKSTCTSTTPQLLERAGADACLSTLHSKIDPSELAAKGVLRARRRRRDLQKLDLIEVLSALLRGEAQIVGGVLELAYYRASGDGQTFPTRERHRVFD